MSGDMHSYFETSVAAMRRVVEHIDQAYAKPGVSYAALSFQKRPIFTAFAVIFAALSLLPVLSFTFFSLFVAGTFLSVALCGAVVASLLATLVAGGILAGTLVLLFFVASFLTACTIATLLVVRLALLVRTRGAGDGAVQWSEEIRGHWRGRADENLKESHASDDFQLDMTTFQEDESDSESTVIVGAPEYQVKEVDYDVKSEASEG